MKSPYLRIVCLALLLAGPLHIVPTQEHAAGDEPDRFEMSFFSSPKVGGGNLTQGSVRYNWTPDVSSRIGFAYATETFNVEYDDEDILDSLALVTNDEYRLDVVPYEVLRGRSRWGLGLNTTIEQTNEYGFYRTREDGTDPGYFLSFEENRSRVFISPRLGWRYQIAGDFLVLRTQLWLSPLFLASLDESYRYEFDNEGEQEEIIDGIGFGYPEIEMEASLEIGRFFRMDMAMIYRYFVLEELELLFDAEDEVYFDQVETAYDMLRLLVTGSVPITMPNQSRFRVGAGLLLYMERNLTAGLDRFEPGVSLVFGVD